MAVLPSAAPAANVYDQWRSGLQKAQKGECRESLKLLDEVIRSKPFAAAEEHDRINTYQAAAFCAVQLNDEKAIYRYAMAGTRSGPGGDALWFLRFAVEAERKWLAQGVESIEAMAARKPEALNALQARILFPFYGKLMDAPDQQLRTRFLKVLAAPGYQPDDPLITGDFFRRQRAAQLMEAGDKAGAAALVARIVEPMVLVGVSLDPRLRSLIPDDFDERAVTEARLARVREIAVSHAASMEAVLRVASYQRLLGRPEEAVATLEAARPDGPMGKSFTDLATQENWWWDGIARSYAMLGRYDQAVEAFRQGIAAKEGGGLNVSQTINLGHTHLQFGHPERAMEAVATFAKGKYSASPYGEMELRLVRACAHAALGQLAEAGPDVDYAGKHESDDPEAAVGILLCVGDLDGAAAAMIRRLDDPDQRLGALEQLSQFDPPPAGPSKAAYDVRLPELAARPDVQAAVRRAGGTRRFRLQADEQ